MKIEVTIPKEEVKWNFPCKGICKEYNLIVGFSGYRIGVVLNTGQCGGLSLYDFSRGWKMNNFEPLEEEKQPIDWEKAEYPIYAKNDNGEVIIITAIDFVDWEEVIQIRVNMINIQQLKYAESMFFTGDNDLNEWMNSLEILPKGTKIEITL